MDYGTRIGMHGFNRFVRAQNAQNAELLFVPRMAGTKM